MSLFFTQSAAAGAEWPRRYATSEYRQRRDDADRGRDGGGGWVEQSQTICLFGTVGELGWYSVRNGSQAKCMVIASHSISKNCRNLSSSSEGDPEPGATFAGYLRMKGK